MSSSLCIMFRTLTRRLPAWSVLCAKFLPADYCVTCMLTAPLFYLYYSMRTWLGACITSPIKSLSSEYDALVPCYLYLWQVLLFLGTLYREGK